MPNPKCSSIVIAVVAVIHVDAEERVVHAVGIKNSAFRSRHLSQDPRHAQAGHPADSELADEDHTVEFAEVVRPAYTRVLRIGLPIKCDGVTQLIARSHVASHGLNAARIGPLVHHE
jgi:hypothetical protein